MTGRAARWAVLAAAAGLLVAACGNGEADDTSATSGPDGVVAQVASYDIAADREGRFIVGLFSGEEGMVSYGSAELSFEYLGAKGAMLDEPVRGQRVTATFVPVPGSPGPGAGQGPRFTSPSEARGVYGADAVRFDEPGYWEVTVDVEIEGTRQSATAAFEVAEESHVPAPGDAAPRTENLLPGNPDAPPDAVDSRADEDGTVPDPTLHEETVATAIAAGRPVMVVVSTPVYCVSRFCGPITDEIDELAQEHGDRMDFVHIEVYKDFEGDVVNRAAAEWIWPDQQGDPAEPWVFLVDSTGTVVQRWDNVASDQSLTEAIEEVLGGAT